MQEVGVGDVFFSEVTLFYLFVYLFESLEASVGEAAKKTLEC